MISFYLLWTLCYLVLLVWIGGKWPKPKTKTNPPGYFPPVTLLIPLRNEIENLGILVSEIKKINYAALRILLVDDQSEDGTFSFLQENLRHDPRVSVLQSGGGGKKVALELGVSNAETELIVCTDADCRFTENWVEKMVEPFVEPSVQMTCAPVISSDRHTFFQRFQQIEWASILLVTQYFFSIRQPRMCSGANLAYRKSAFVAVGGYRQNLRHLSGDDEFLLKGISAHFGRESCVYLPSSESLVVTRPQASLSQLISQRVRWAGKWKLHGDLAHAFWAAASVLIQGIWVASSVLLGFGFDGVLVFLIVWLGKIGTERLALGKVLHVFGFSHSIADYVLTSLAHPFYVIRVAVGALRGKFVWKGRSN